MKIKTSLLIFGSLVSPSFAALFASGHGDIGIAYEDEGDGPEFFLHVHLHGEEEEEEGHEEEGEEHEHEGMEYEPSDITIVAPSSTRANMPSNAILNLGTGVPEGSPIWILPQGNVEGVPFLGIATEELDGGLFPGGSTFELMGINSPSGTGSFSVWQQSGIGAPEFFFSSDSPGLTTDDNKLILSTGAHDHYNYGFSEPGMWEVELSVSAMLNGTTPLVDTETFSFQVIPEPSTALLGLIGALGLLRRRR